VHSGRIPASRILDAAQRVARLKAWLAAQSPADPAWLGHPDHRAWSASMGRDALTLLRDDTGLLPLDRTARIAAIEFFHSWQFQMAAERPTATSLDRALAGRFPNSSVLVVPGNQPTTEDYTAARAAVDAADIVLLGTRGANRFPAQADFVATVLGWGKPTIAVALADPYDSLAYPAAPTTLAAYGADPTMLNALGAVLAGEETARGTLPVTLA
jgi:beta-N-acetylhexosaminidase